MMNEKCAVFRDEAGLTEAQSTIRRLKEEADVAAIDDRGTVFNQDVLGALELQYMLDDPPGYVTGTTGRRSTWTRSPTRPWTGSALAHPT